MFANEAHNAFFYINFGSMLRIWLGFRNDFHGVMCYRLHIMKPGVYPVFTNEGLETESRRYNYYSSSHMEEIALPKFEWSLIFKFDVNNQSWVDFKLVNQPLL
jgi:hypothetical protein